MDCRRLIGWLMAMTFPASWTYGQVAEGRDSSDVQALDGKQLQEIFVSPVAIWARVSPRTLPWM